MNITQKWLRTIIAEFTDYNSKFLCLASKTFRDMWTDVPTNRRLRRVAQSWLRATQNTNFYVSIGTGLFYARRCSCDNREQHRAVRLEFLRALLEQRAQRSHSKQRNNTPTQ